MLLLGRVSVATAGMGLIRMHLVTILHSLLAIEISLPELLLLLLLLLLLRLVLLLRLLLLLLLLWATPLLGVMSSLAAQTSLMRGIQERGSR